MEHVKSSDVPYKLMYQDRGLLEDTVRLVAPGMADARDFESAVALDKEHLATTGRTRLQDKACLIEPQDPRRPGLLVLLEFQTGQDQDMALRMEEYAYLAATGAPADARPGADAGRLPEVLPLVVHNGEHPWRASAEGVARRIGAGRRRGWRRTIRWTCRGWRRSRTTSDGGPTSGVFWRRWRGWRRRRRSGCRRRWRMRSGATGDDGEAPDPRRYDVELLNRVVHINVPRCFCGRPTSGPAAS